MKKTICQWKPQDTTSCLGCLRFALSLFSPRPQRIPSTLHHSSLRQNHLSGSIIPIILASAAVTETSLLTAGHNSMLKPKFFSGSSSSPPVPSQKLHRALLKEDTVYKPPLNPYLESSCLPASSNEENKNIFLRCRDPVVHADKAQLTPQIIFLMMSRLSMVCPQEWEYFLDDQNTPRESELNTGNKPISTFKLSTRFRL